MDDLDKDEPDGADFATVDGLVGEFLERLAARGGLCPCCVARASILNGADLLVEAVGRPAAAVAILALVEEIDESASVH